MNSSRRTWLASSACSTRTSTSDPTFHLEFRGLAAMRPMMAEAARTIARVVIEVEHEVVAAPWVVARHRQRVFRRDGRTIDVRGVSLFRVANGRVAEWHDYYDAVGYQRQMGGGGSPVDTSLLTARRRP